MTPIEPQPVCHDPETTQRLNTRFHLISESTGALASHMVSVALSQFPNFTGQLGEHPFCDSIKRLGVVLSQLEQGSRTVILSALTKPELRTAVARWCLQHKVQHRELLQPLVDTLAGCLNQTPAHDISRIHRFNDEYLSRIDAWEFSLQHDDGQRIESINQADIILLGVSRVGKTPLAAYLGSQGYRVANISLAREVSIQPEICKLRKKCIGLVVTTDRLTQVRRRRFELNRFSTALKSFPNTDQSYCSRNAAMADLRFADEQFRRLRIRTIDVTDLTVEESSVRILKMLKL